MSCAISVGSAFFSLNIFIVETVSAEVSKADTISTMWRILILVSVTTRELLSAFAVSVAEPGSGVARSREAWVASMRRSGMICMYISAVMGISWGSLPVRI